MRDSPFARAGWAGALMALLLFRASYGAEASAAPTPQGKPDGSVAQLTLDEWRALRKLVQEVASTTPGPERIARCEAFLKEHPDDPSSSIILDSLLVDKLMTPGFDPNDATDLLEKMAASRASGYGEQELYVVQEYCLPYHFPIASCQAILGRSRKAFEASRRLEKRDEVSSLWGRSVAAIECQLLLEEGRVLLEAGDSSGALQKLLQSEACRERDGSLVSLRDSRGGGAQFFPTPSGDANWLNLSLAEAYARSGKNGEAVERLRWIQGTGEPERGFRARLHELEAQLKVTPVEMTEFRGEAVPAPDFELEDLEGKKVRLSDFSGKVVLVLIWDTW